MKKTGGYNKAVYVQPLDLQKTKICIIWRSNQQESLHV